MFVFIKLIVLLTIVNEDHSLTIVNNEPPLSKRENRLKGICTYHWVVFFSENETIVFQSFYPFYSYVYSYSDNPSCSSVPRVCLNIVELKEFKVHP